MRLWVLYAEGLNDNHKYQEETDTHVVYTSKFNSQKKKKSSWRWAWICNLIIVWFCMKKLIAVPAMIDGLLRFLWSFV